MGWPPLSQPGFAATQADACAPPRPLTGEVFLGILWQEEDLGLLHPRQVRAKAAQCRPPLTAGSAALPAGCCQRWVHGISPEAAGGWTHWLSVTGFVSLGRTLKKLITCGHREILWGRLISAWQYSASVPCLLWVERWPSNHFGAGGEGKKQTECLGF